MKILSFHLPLSEKVNFEHLLINIAGIVENDGCFYFQEQIMIDENHLI